MRPLRNIPIEHKLRLMIAGVAVFTLLSAAGVFVPWAVERFESEQEAELRAMAGSVGFSASFALALWETEPESKRALAREEVREVIRRMVAGSDVVAAAIYHLGGNQQSEKVAEFVRDGAVPPPEEFPRIGFDPQTLEFVTEVLNVQENVFGRVYMRADLGRKRAFERRMWTAVTVALVCALVVTMLAGLLVKRAIVGPLHGLLLTTRLVRREHDYAARADVHGEDEVGQLGEGFNAMLDQIQRQDAELRRHQQTLESQVAEQTRELREANMELIAAKDKADAANRTKSTFLANVSHELRTPLNSIIGYSEIVREEVDEAGLSALRPDLEKIHRSGKNLLALINDVLDLSKIEAGRMTLTLERFDMVRLLEEVREDLKPMADARGNRIVFDPPGERLTVYADRTKVRQIVANLISNACKFSEAGLVKISLVGEGLGSEERVIVRVADTGEGLNADDLKRVFVPFVQVGKAAVGTGLGLPISRRLCRSMGGDLQATSEPGQGSVFEASFSKVVEKRQDLPLVSAEEESDSLEPAVGARGAPPARNRRVLVVDDEDSARELLCRQLARDGFEVISANSGEKGLRMAREELPDAVTLDVCMPGMTGWEFSREMARDPRIARIPIVVVTMLEEAEEQYRDVAADVLLKPVEPGKLLRVMRRVTKC